MGSDAIALREMRRMSEILLHRRHITPTFTSANMRFFLWAFGAMVINKNKVSAVILDDSHNALMSSFGFILAFPSDYGYYVEKLLNTFELSNLKYEIQ